MRFNDKTRTSQDWTLWTLLNCTLLWDGFFALLFLFSWTFFLFSWPIGPSAPSIELLKNMYAFCSRQQQNHLFLSLYFIARGTKGSTQARESREMAYRPFSLKIACLLQAWILLEWRSNKGTETFFFKQYGFETDNILRKKEPEMLTQKRNQIKFDSKSWIEPSHGALIHPIPFNPK